MVRRNHYEDETAIVAASSEENLTEFQNNPDTVLSQQSSLNSYGPAQREKLSEGTKKLKYIPIFFILAPEYNFFRKKYKR